MTAPKLNAATVTAANEFMDIAELLANVRSRPEAVAGLRWTLEHTSPELWRWLYEQLEEQLCFTHTRVVLLDDYGQPSHYCADCEPPEPDGEAFRGGEAAAYAAELQDRARRL